MLFHVPRPAAWLSERGFSGLFVELSKSEIWRNAAWEECSTSRDQFLQEYLAAQVLSESSRIGSSIGAVGGNANSEAC